MKSDSQLQSDVLAELKWEPSVQSAHIGVAVKDGVVTLAGHVDSYAERWHAERAAQRVGGVRALAVEIDVRLAGSDQHLDADIAGAIGNALKWIEPVKDGAVKIRVEAGWVTLAGEVDWQFQRTMAHEAVMPIMGVRGISDHIAIKPHVSVNNIKVDIEAALKRRAESNAQRIQVQVEGANVTLSGIAHSWADRELTASSAWGTPGVHRVVNNMTIA
ncbi:MAG: BON domain-containing protein [Burkholderiales bacterium]